MMELAARAALEKLSDRPLILIEAPARAIAAAEEFDPEDRGSDLCTGCNLPLEDCECPI